MCHTLARPERHREPALVVVGRADVEERALVVVGRAVVEKRALVVVGRADAGQPGLI